VRVLAVYIHQVLAQRLQLGLGGLLAAWPAALAALRWTGAAFLLWLAWTVWSAPVSQAAAGAPGATPDRPAAAAATGFWQALAFQWVNPKAWIVGASAAGTFGAAAGGTVLERALQLGGVFALAAAPACALWLVAGAALQRWLHEPRRARAFHRVMGALLALSVLLVLR